MANQVPAKKKHKKAAKKAKAAARNKNLKPLVFYVDPGLKARIVRAANAKDTTISGFVLSVLEKAV